MKVSCVGADVPHEKSTSTTNQLEIKNLLKGISKFFIALSAFAKEMGNVPRLRDGVLREAAITLHDG